MLKAKTLKLKAQSLKLKEEDFFHTTSVALAENRVTIKSPGTGRGTRGTRSAVPGAGGGPTLELRMLSPSDSL